jgi:TRAP-type C4-dicarboxylate transport system permease small subunit
VRGIERGVARLTRFFEQVAAGACLVCFGTVCYAVAARYFFGRPQPWSDEAVGWLIVVTVMLALPEAQRRGEHLGVDLLIERSGPRGRQILQIVGTLFVLVVAAMFVWEGIQTVRFTHMVGIVSNALPQIPLWAVQAFIPLGGALLFLVGLVQLAAWLEGREPEGIEHDRIDATE